jgi:cysteine/O-acetylserine efflux protein
MHNFFPFLSYVLITTFTPGPNNLLSMANAKKYGFKKSFKYNLGILMGFIVIMLLCSYFNLSLLKLMPKVKSTMEIFGALYMLYLAYKISFSKSNSVSDKKANQTNNFLSGLSMQFINPKVILYGITVIGTFITPYYKSNLNLIFFSILLALVGFIATLCWALCGALLQNFLTKHDKSFRIVMSLLLVYCAVSISGLTH